MLNHRVIMGAGERPQSADERTLIDVLGPPATRELFLDWMLIAQVPTSAFCVQSGQDIVQSAGPSTLIEVLSVAPDVYVPAICEIFQARNIDNAVCQESAARSCYGDCDSNGVLDIFDFLCFQNAYVAGDPYADCDRDGQWTLFDFVCFQSEFVAVPR